MGWVNVSSTDENYAHITDDEWTKCREVCDSISSWMYDAMDKQGSLSSSDNPAVTVAEINGKSNEITKAISPIMHKPKPKPKAEEKPAEGEPMETDEKPTEGEGKAEPMD